MIPLKLQIKNFLSYGPELQTIDFAAYHLICLSGKNGHGKSALLDAITWALWGQARKPFGTTKADENLVRLGQTLMMVVFDFSFNGQTYRIRREFAKTYGKPYAVLEFGMLDIEKESVIPLTDKTIRQTQEKIERLLNLDLDSFVNSAFLRQGQANEFSKKTAKDRKTVLATILGLNRYDILRVLAMDKVKEATITKAHQLTLQEKRAQDIATKPTITHQIEQLTAHLQDLAKQDHDITVAKQALEQQRQELLLQQQAQQLVSFQYHQSLEQEAHHHRKVSADIHTWRTFHKKLLRTGNAQELQKQKQELLHSIHSHQQMLQHTLELKTTILQHKEAAALHARTIQENYTQQLQQQRLSLERLDVEQRTLYTACKEHEQRRASAITEHTTLAGDIRTLTDMIATAHTLQLAIAPVEQQFEKRKEYYQKFVAQGTWIKQELEALTQKQGLVHDDDNPSCPLCEQNLSATRKKFLKKRFEDHERLLLHRMGRIKKVTLALKALLVDQHTQLQTAKNALKEQDVLRAHLQESEKRLITLNTAIQDITTVLEQMILRRTELEQTITTQQKNVTHLLLQEQQALLHDSDYQKRVATLAQLEQQLHATMYDSAKHNHAQQQLQSVEQQLLEYAQLEQQKAVQEQRLLTICNEIKALKQLRLHIKELATQLAAYHHLPLLAQRLLDQEQALIKTAQELRRAKEQSLQEKGNVEAQHNKIIQLEKEFEEQEQSLKGLNAYIEDYQAIATATSKDGIQALLIEEAIPEIEQEANQLLAKLTNNQAQIFIESLRDLKKGGTKETLDIKISDSIGIRPYELFSGGEAFRIDFALRIAISKLLARRAGTSLQTLIIDEGFGSQDEEGLSNIMEALYKIQDDFAKIIIVSHLPFMKDQFPVHFVVEKGPNGSVVKVIEQG